MFKKKLTLLLLIRLIVGLLFIFSGLIKLNDPLGFSYKLEEYFEVFHLLFLSQFAVVFSIILCALEVILGFLLLIGIYGKQVAWALLGLILFFTFLTFYSAYFEVVKTCGCFGDAIPLTPWQSFTKDVILLGLIIVIFLQKDYINPIKSFKNPMLVAGIVTFATLLFGLYTYSFLPIIDFLPYKIGSNIPKAMSIPNGAPKDEFEITYTLKNKTTGSTQLMSDKKYLATKIYNDPNWELISSSEPKLVKEGYQPKIKDLNIFDSQGVDYTKELIENPYYNLIVVAYQLNDADVQKLGDLNALAINASQNFNTRTVLLTSTAPDVASKIAKKAKLFIEIFHADAVPLKSMVRSNPGLILLKNGTVINKWPATALPSYNELSEKYFSNNDIQD